MEYQAFGTITSLGRFMSGTSQKTGKHWESQDFVIKTEEQYPKMMKFTMFGESLDKNLLAMGNRVNVAFSITAREYNDQYYNDVTAYRVTRI